MPDTDTEFPHTPSTAMPAVALLPSRLHERRERVFLVLAGLFLGTLAMLNILGVTRFIAFGSIDTEGFWHWGEFGSITFAVAVGVLPYPLTFLCTDLISEFYGRRRASFVVWVGLILNVWVMFILWVAGVLPPVPAMDPQTGLPPVGHHDYAFYAVRELAFGAVIASMLAYLTAQFVDVYVFHFWKGLTRGKHLWLRNNGSTLISQAVDTVLVILITYWIGGLDGMIGDDTDVTLLLITLILTGYVFKFVAALLDTPVIYLAVRLLSPFLHIDPTRDHDAGREQIQPQ